MGGSAGSVAPPHGQGCPVTRLPVLHPDPYVDRMTRRFLLLGFTGMAACFVSLILAFTWVPTGAHWLLTASLWATRVAYLAVAGIWGSVIQFWLHRRRTRQPGE